MKPPALIATAAALLGFAAGWISKPAPDAPPAVAAGESENAAGRPTKIDRDSRDRAERPLVLKARGSAAAREADPETVANHVQFERTFGDVTQRAENARLSRLAEALGLSPDQRATLEAMLSNRKDGFRDLLGGGKNPAEALQEAAAAEQRFEEEVAKILDPEQVDALAAFREREKENDIEARAQRDLADLIGQVDLSPSQREEALEVMRADSSTAAANRPAGWSLMNESMDLIGGSQVAIAEDLGGLMNDPEAMKDPMEVQRRLVQAQRDAATRKLGKLEAILTPGQLAQYRASLEARSTLMEQFTPPPVDKR